MTRYLLDTSICVELIRRPTTRLLAQFVRHPPQALAISAITLAELDCGVAKSSDPASAAAGLRDFLIPICVEVFDFEAAGAYGEIRAELERAGTPIGPLDTLIAAHALALGVPLVTKNEQEFRRVAGLRVENWVSGPRPRPRPRRD